MRYHTRFLVSDNYNRGWIFKRMFKDISKKTDLEKDCIENCSERAFTKWEIQKRRGIHTIFALDIKEREQEVDKIIEYFNENMKNYTTEYEETKPEIEIASNLIKKIFLI